MKVIADVGNSDYYIRRAIETLSIFNETTVKMAISLLALALVADRKERAYGTQTSKSPEKQRRRKVVPRPEASNQQPSNHGSGGESGKESQDVGQSGSGNADQRAVLTTENHPYHK